MNRIAAKWPLAWHAPVGASIRRAAADFSFERNRAAWFAALALVFALQTALVLTHVPWLDEWQALLIAYQSPTASMLLQNLRFEGHPPLWYAVLRAIAAVAPFGSVLTIASLLMATAMQALIQFRAPFPRLERILLGLGEIALFEYGAIARSVALGALVMLAAAALWRRPAVWLPIAVLPMCDFLFGVVALIMAALLFAERRVSRVGAAALLGMSALAAWTVWPDPRVIAAEAPLGILSELSDLMIRMGGLLVPFQTYHGRIAWDGYLPGGSILTVVFLVWMRQRFAGQLTRLAAVFALIVVCCATSVAIYSLHLRHLSVIAWFVVVLAWIDGQPTAREHLRWRAWLLTGAVCGIGTSAVALATPFDAAPQVARTIASLDDGRRPLLVYPPRHIAPLAAHLRRPLFSPQQGCSETFVRWDFSQRLQHPRRLRAALAGWADRYGQSLLVIDPLPGNVPRDVFLPLTGKLHGYDGQGYVVGILGPGRPVKPFAAAPCVPGLKPLP